MKYIFVTGGVLSSLGKGIIASSIGNLIKATGHSVTMLKIDPYLNIDPGTMNPLEHGEVFVTDDGSETDLDIGNYERFLDISLDSKNNFTAGQIYNTVLQNERKGKYLGKTVQVVPHVTDEIIKRIKKAKIDHEFLVIELGGTVGDIEGLPFLEALRKMRYELGENNCFFIHTTLLPLLSTTNELKTKPTQHSIQELRKLGINPDMLIVRSTKPIKDIKHKIVFSSGLNEGVIIECLDERSIYSVPLTFNRQKILEPIYNKLGVKYSEPDISKWSLLVSNILHSHNTLNIAIVGKYVKMSDAYKSLNEALVHSGSNINYKINIELIDSDELTDEVTFHHKFNGIDGIVVPGGFGKRGTDEIMSVIKYARENDVPFLGICLGMQLAVIEYAKNVIKIKNATSLEFDENASNNVITLIEKFEDRDGVVQKRDKNSNLGGSMRLGLYPCTIDKNSKLYKFYNSTNISERHRHRYEFNPEFEEIFNSDKDFKIVAKNINQNLVDVIEISSLKYFVAVQYHPELTSRLNNPNPTINSFIETISNYKIKP